tara:strand:- start:350 stop:913 length:564 start_codon:yes stop_codon:yes gene_type:complete
MHIKTITDRKGVKMLLVEIIKLYTDEIERDEIFSREYRIVEDLNSHTNWEKDPDHYNVQWKKNGGVCFEVEVLFDYCWIEESHDPSHDRGEWHLYKGDYNYKYALQRFRKGDNIDWYFDSPTEKEIVAISGIWGWYEEDEKAHKHLLKKTGNIFGNYEPFHIHRQKYKGKEYTDAQIAFAKQIQERK